MHKQRHEWQTVVQKILHHMESFWRAGGASRKRPSDRPSTQRLAHAQQFGKRAITQAPALTSGIVLAEGAISDLDLAQVTIGKWRAILGGLRVGSLRLHPSSHARKDRSAFPIV